jgi:hypothetical protein
MPKQYIQGHCARTHGKSHNQRHCRDGETWVEGYEREVRATKKSVKAIQKQITSAVRAHRIARQCDDREVAEAINICMNKFIDTVREHMATREHLGLQSYPSESTLQMIQRSAHVGTKCVLLQLSHCGGDKGQMRVLVDQYIQDKLNVGSMIPEMEKNIINAREQKITSLQDWLTTYKATVPSGNPYGLSDRALTLATLAAA